MMGGGGGQLSFVLLANRVFFHLLVTCTWWAQNYGVHQIRLENLQFHCIEHLRNWFTQSYVLCELGYRQHYNTSELIAANPFDQVCSLGSSLSVMQERSNRDVFLAAMGVDPSTARFRGLEEENTGAGKLISLHSTISYIELIGGDEAYDQLATMYPIPRGVSRATDLVSELIRMEHNLVRHLRSVRKKSMVLSALYEHHLALQIELELSNNIAGCVVFFNAQVSPALSHLYEQQIVEKESVTRPLFTYLQFCRRMQIDENGVCVRIERLLYKLDTVLFCNNLQHQISDPLGVLYVSGQARVTVFDERVFVPRTRVQYIALFSKMLVFTKGNGSYQVIAWIYLTEIMRVLLLSSSTVQIRYREQSPESVGVVQIQFNELEVQAPRWYDILQNLRLDDRLQRNAR